MCIATVYPIRAIALSIPLVFSVFSLKAVSDGVFNLQPRQSYAEKIPSRDRVIKDDLLTNKFPSPQRVLRKGEFLA